MILNKHKSTSDYPTLDTFIAATAEVSMVNL